MDQQLFLGVGAVAVAVVTGSLYAYEGLLYLDHVTFLSACDLVLNYDECDCDIFLNLDKILYCTLEGIMFFDAADFYIGLSTGISTLLSLSEDDLDFFTGAGLVPTYSRNEESEEELEEESCLCSMFLKNVICRVSVAGWCRDEQSCSQYKIR